MGLVVSPDNLASFGLLCLVVAGLDRKSTGFAMGVYRDRITEKLTRALAPRRLEIVDDSERHHGHAGAHADGGGETHFNVTVESDAFIAKSRLERQRLVYALLADELRERVHALALKLVAPGEN